MVIIDIVKHTKITGICQIYLEYFMAVTNYKLFKMCFYLCGNNVNSEILH